MKEYLDKLQPETVIERLQQGETIYGMFGEKIFFEKGFPVLKSNIGYVLFPQVAMTVNWYFERPEPEIIIEVGKFYKTRGDRKVFAFMENTEGRICVVIEGMLPYTVSKNGYVSEEAEDDNDLVELFYKKENTYKEKVIQMIDDGLSIKEIAEKLGKRYQAVAQFVRLNGIPYTKHTKNKFMKG